MSTSSTSAASTQTRVGTSYLFVPGDRPERFAKAAASGADRIIIDLEDAVAPASKPAARAAALEWLRTGAPAMVRINGCDTPWFHDDLRMLEDFATAGLMVPKADADVMAAVAAAADTPRAELVALVETVAGWASARQILATGPTVRLAFGNIDFALDSGLADGDDTLAAVRAALVLESRLAGKPAPIDGVSLELTDATVIARHAQQSKRWGFGGKLCIHPRQVEAVNLAFRPSPHDCDWARRVLDAAGASGGAAVALDGKMIDRPVIERARRILAEAG
jgi:citrate lyase subunit beta/citryl-CoA lyase